MEITRFLSEANFSLVLLFSQFTAPFFNLREIKRDATFITAEDSDNSDYVPIDDQQVNIERSVSQDQNRSSEGDKDVIEMV